MRKRTTTQVLLTIVHDKPLPEITDIAAGRVFTLDGVCDVTATLVEASEQGKPFDPFLPPKKSSGKTSQESTK